MAEMQECVQILRRRVGDTETPYVFEDDLLIGYITDAVLHVELDHYRGISVMNNEFETAVDAIDAVLICIKAHYLLKLRTKDKADRDNFLMRKGRLTLDNTGQSGDHAETLKLINSEYQAMLVKVKNGGSSMKGVRME
ncbi:hypothetical protein D3C72_1636880 [compost metagenome]